MRYRNRIHNRITQMKQVHERNTIKKHWLNGTCNYLFCCAKAKDRNFDFGRKFVIDSFGTFKTSFIVCLSILSQFRCFSEKIMGDFETLKSPKETKTEHCITHLRLFLFGWNAQIELRRSAFV